MRAEDGNGRSVLPHGRKTRALLAILALRASQSVLRTEITALLWSRRDPPQARASLRQAVHELQLALGTGADLLDAERNYLALRHEGLWVDVVMLLRATPGQPDALAHFRSALLQDLAGIDPAFDRWMATEHDRMTCQARSVAETALSRAQSPGAAIDAAEMLLAIDGGHEVAWRALIQSHAALGDRSAAMLAYERCKTALANRVRLDPSPETEELAAGIRLGGHLSTNVSVQLVGPQACLAAVGRISSRIRLGVTQFRGIPGSTEAALAAGLSEELVAALACFRSIVCVPCGTIPGLAGWAGGMPEGAETLELDCLLDGSVQTDRERVRVTVRVIDLRAGGGVVWARRFDRDFTCLFDLQDEISAALSAQIEARLLVSPPARAISPEAAASAALLGWAVPALHRMDREPFLAAGAVLKQALRLDPLNVAACIWLSHWYVFAAGQGWVQDRRAASAQSREFAAQAIGLDPDDARALALSGHISGFIDQRPDEAQALHARAIQANPNLPLAWCLSGLTESYLGRYDEAIRQINRAIALSPDDPLTFFFEASLAIPHLLNGDYLAAVRIGQRAIALNPGLSSAYKTQLAALGHLGYADEAATIRAQLLALEPRFSVDQAMERSSIANSEGRACYAEGLRLAGLA